MSDLNVEELRERHRIQYDPGSFAVYVCAECKQQWGDPPTEVMRKYVRARADMFAQVARIEGSDDGDR